jgi:cell shape-determining protein MreC
MQIKKDKSYFLYFKIILIFIFFILALIFRTQFTGFVFNFYKKVFPMDSALVLTPDEREELGQLRVENKVLKDENKKVRQEFSVGEIDEKKATVYMLLGQSTIYSDFYVSLPEDKTPYVGMNIFSSGNVVIGQVAEILSNSLKIKRLGQDKTFIANSLENDDPVELQSLSDGLYFGKVSGGSKIVTGDTIVMKGYPKAVVGTVVDIQKGDAAQSTIYVRAPYDLNNKEIFYVLQ